MENIDGQSLLTPRRTRGRQVQRILQSLITQIRTAEVQPNSNLLETQHMPGASHQDNAFESLEIEINTRSNNSDEQAPSEILCSSEGVLEMLQSATQNSHDEFSHDKCKQLAKWSLSNNITHAALSGLLELCRNWLPNSGFPKDPRTLLNTQRVVNLEESPGGVFYHFGVGNQLIQKSWDNF